MSPFFGNHHDADTEADASEPDQGHLPRLIELGAVLDEAVKDAAAMPLPRVASKLMSELFGSNYQPRGNGVDIDTIAAPLVPPNSGSKFGDPTPEGVDILWDIAVEQGTVEQLATAVNG